jgi:hypothetical protein
VAGRIYECRLSGRLSELAAALEHAGCGDQALIGHCRADVLHVRGCWAVDLVLANE